MEPEGAGPQQRSVTTPDRARSAGNRLSRSGVRTAALLVTAAVCFALLIAHDVTTLRGDADGPLGASSAPTFVAGPEGTVVSPNLDAEGNPTAGPAIVGEVPPPAETGAAEGPGAAAPLPALPPLAIPSPTPGSASTEGDLVDGFPDDVISVPAVATVLTTSVSSDGTVIQVTLTATSPDGASETLDFYRRTLGGLGFAESPRPAVAETTAVAFTRGGNALLVSVRPEGRGSAFSVSGVLRPSA